MRRPSVVVDSGLRDQRVQPQRKAIPNAVEKSGFAEAGQWESGATVRAHGTDLVRGVEFVRRYFDTLGLVRLVRRELAGVLPRTDFGVPAMVLAILALLIAGGRRLRHLRYVDGDPLVLRLCGLRRLPTPRTVGRWLRVFRAEHLLPLQWLNALLVARAIRHAGVRRLTIDVDGSVVSTGQQVQWAQRGFNPH